MPHYFPSNQMLFGLFGLACMAAALPGTAQAATPCLSKDKLPAVSGTVVNVANASELQAAISNLQDNTTLLLKAGTYNLSSTLYVRKKNVVLRGDGASCEQTILVGKGMDNASYGNVPHGVWTDAVGLTIMNLSIRDVYQHAIIFNSGAQSPTVNSVQLLNAGQQMLKSNPTAYGVGVDNGVVVNSYFAYTNGAPATDHGSGVGYTNGVDVHGGKNWKIAGNRFESFHTPDSSAWWWNPAILMWNGAAGTTAENNVFVNVDRAIAFGLMERGGSTDHQGGVIRNNMIYYAPNLFSADRKYDSDAAIIVWNSPGSTVAHNTVLTNGNLNKSVEFRFNTAGGQAINNLVDAAIGTRNSGTFAQTGNYTSATSAMFQGASTGNLHLLPTATGAINKVNKTDLAPIDVDGNTRGTAGTVDIGAHEYGIVSPPNPPSNVSGQQSP